MKQLTIGESFKGFLNSLKVNNSLDSMNEQELYNYIFEVFLGDIVAYLSPYTLDRLETEGIIDNDIYNISRNIRKELFEMINGPLWNIKSVKTSEKWSNIFESLETLDILVHQKWSEEEIAYLKTLK
ncbi:hypothetical protein [Listeria seeligeri]|uniref:hypothetical protein n=1 Tax=Listeria seeligeri TaxID=1640 RepID=UPI0016248F0E|nr:hypothetical protein [Listeria seeligeri]MBC1471720.1 hypothetical protein [Listeria seeligeri]MBC1738382.1 hypothetical protein [Listeria seeligeri]